MPTSRSKVKTIGITLGDPSGIGPEIVSKALRQKSIQKLGSKFVIIGHTKICQKYKITASSNCQIVEPEIKLTSYTMGRPSTQSARLAYTYLKKSVKLIKSGAIQALVTAPLCKEKILTQGVKFEGHTEFLANAFKVKKFDMMFVTNELKTVIVTRHVPIKKLSQAITQRKVYNTVKLTQWALKKYFRIRNPKIAVCGLNPHAGEEGTMGSEEKSKIIPALKRARQSRINVTGPLAADTLFVPTNSKKYDAIVAMYHDQGLIPVKSLYFTKIVNLTIGLPFIRTSPAHGTAFDIAGKNKADILSMCAAIKLAGTLS